MIIREPTRLERCWWRVLEFRQRVLGAWDVLRGRAIAVALPVNAGRWN